MIFSTPHQVPAEVIKPTTLHPVYVNEDASVEERIVDSLAAYKKLFKQKGLSSKVKGKGY